MKTTRCYLLLVSENLLFNNLLGKLTKTFISIPYFLFSQISAINANARLTLSMLSVCCSLLLFLISYYSVIVKFSHWGFVG